LFRLLPQDFGEVQHPNGVAPAWPLTYEDMEPYYGRAEQLFWVHGQHGEDPFAGSFSQEYKHPPVAHEPHIQEMSDGLQGLGLHPFHLPLGVQLEQDAHGMPTRESLCLRCDRIDGFPCPVGAKADAETAVLRPALATHPNLQLMTQTTVERVLTDNAGGSARGVAVTLADGSSHVFTADIVVLSAGAILSAALLLNSATEKQPQGLANSSDMVGRNYMCHNNLALIAFSRKPNPTVFQKTLALNDFYGPSDAWAYPMGNIQMLGKSDDWQLKGAAPRGLAWAPSAPYAQVAKHSVDFWLCSEDIPLADSRVTLRPDGAIKLALQPNNNVEAVMRLRHTLQEKLTKLGMVHMRSVRSLYLHKGFEAAATAHQAGTVRFGTNPSASVLDVNCKAHDLDNLYVVDGSFMPSIGAVNPTLTIIANALRVGDRIAERIGTTGGQPSTATQPAQPRVVT
jgi:choline dehydrogenase-like flavoprotein